LKSAALNDAGLNMTVAPGMRDLAHRLLSYEAGAGKSSEPMESPILRAYEKLRQSLVSFAGVAGFQSLASRALVLAQTEAPSLCAVQVTVDGALQGLGDFEPQTNMDKDQAGNQQAGEDPHGDAGAILIARILGLLLIFLGEALTLNLLRNAWPDATFDDRNSVHGRKA
jgi:hypothetical protein